MPTVIAVTSEKGGVGKSTLAVHLTAAFAGRGLNAALIDEDGRVGSSRRWAQRAEQVGQPLPFPVYEPDDVKPKKLADLDVLVIDTEGRPKRRDLRALAGRADLILVPSGPSPLELEATLDLVDYLHKHGSGRGACRVVLTRVPAVGQGGEAAREDLRDGGVTVCNTLIRQYAAYTRAAEQGGLVRDLPDPRAQAAWGDVLALSRELQ